MDAPSGASRILRTFRSRGVRSVGLRRRFLTDLYHALLTCSWTRLFLLIALAYVLANALFAGAFLAVGGGVEGARPGDLADAFLLSFQAMATIGAGTLLPASTAARVLVSFKALAGMLGTAMVTGLIFTKFSRLRARVMFSRNAVVGPYDGVPSLMFRIANERASQIVEAQLRVMLARDETTAEGRTVRTVHDLELKRSETALFALSWTAIHPITRDSPLHGESAASLVDSGAEIIVSVTGFDESLLQTVHARHVYDARDVAFDACFAEISSHGDDGVLVIDYRRFHDVEALPPAPPVQRRERA